MRRAAAWSVLVLWAGLGVSGIGTAGEEALSGHFQTGKGAVAKRGPVGMDVAAARRDAGLDEIPPEPVVHHAPLPGPIMPYSGPDVAFDFPTPAVFLDPPPGLSRNFPALDDNGTAIPPDTHGAVGWDKVMTALNTEVRVQDRFGAEDSRASLNTFWGGVATAGVFDPRVHFDPDPAWGGRWIWAAVQGARLPSSGTLLGVSLGSSPALGNGVLIDTPDNTVWADYPNVGFNKKWIVVTVNMFLVLDNSWDSSYFYIFDKAKLYQSQPTTPTVIFSGGDGSTHVPALTYDFTAEELYFLQTWNPGVNALRLYELTGDVGSETITPLGNPIGPSPWTHTQGPADFAPQRPGCSAACEPNCKIQTNDSRIQNVVYRDGSLWATQTVFLDTPTRSSVQWWEVDPAMGFPYWKQGGFVDDPSAGGFFYAFPSISVNRLGDVMLGYAAFQDGEWARAHYSFRYRGDPAGTMRSEGLVRDGQACYYKILSGSRNRWGDYSATVVDPAGEVKLWTVQEYAELPSVQDKWGTWWGMLDPTRAISITDVSVDEGDAGPTAMTFTLTLSAPTPDTVTVKWSTADDSATLADVDYVGVTNQTATFPPDTVSVDITVTVNGDNRYEGDETLLVNLTDPTNAVIAVGQATGTILDDDWPRISIGDVTRAEGSSPPDPANTPFTFLVTLSNPSDAAVTVAWSTAAGGTALSGTDYAPAAGGLTFTPGDLEETATVLVVADLDDEPDETFHVQLSSPTGGDIVKGLGIGTILNDDLPEPAVGGLAVVSEWEEAPVNQANNHLYWVNPTGGSPVQILVAWTTSAAPCATYPTNPASGIPVPFGTAGEQQVWDHKNLTVDTYYCYTVWVDYGGSVYSAGENGMGQPFNSEAVGVYTEWRYFTGTAALAPPTVGLDGVLAPANDSFVHAMERGDSGGAWPAGWRPPHLGSPAQQRSPIVPLGGVSRGYYSTQDGWMHAVDTGSGALIWSTQLTPPNGGAAPAGIFVDWGGVGNYILAATSDANGNAVYALDPFTGAVLDRYPDGVSDPAVDIGPIYSMPAVDYARRRLYFASFAGGSPETVWCLQLGPPSNPLSHGWKLEHDYGTPVPTTLGNITGSPVLRGDRLYLGADSGVVWAIDVDTATDTSATVYGKDTGDPGPIDFVWPDRRNGRLYLSTPASVWAYNDTGTEIEDPVWQILLNNASAPLQWPGTQWVYVGVEDYFGKALLMQIAADEANPSLTLKSEVLQPSPIAIGPPSLDIGNDLVHVGSEAGVVYAVKVPLP